MKEDTKADYIKYRIEKSFESLNDAKLLANNKRWNACINRLYYSLFYSINTLLLQYNHEAHSHKGVRNQFNLQFIKTEKINKEYGKLFSKLFDWRHKGDYGDLFDFKEEQVIPLIEPTENLIKEIKNLINEKPPDS